MVSYPRKINPNDHPYISNQPRFKSQPVMIDPDLIPNPQQFMLNYNPQLHSQTRYKPQPETFAPLVIQKPEQTVSFENEYPFPINFTQHRHSRVSNH
jgi:hypothetical protein